MPLPPYVGGTCDDMWDKWTAHGAADIKGCFPYSGYSSRTQPAGQRTPLPSRHEQNQDERSAHGAVTALALQPGPGTCGKGSHMRGRGRVRRCGNWAVFHALPQARGGGGVEQGVRARQLVCRFQQKPMRLYAASTVDAAVEERM